MRDPSIGDILRVAVKHKLPVSVQWSQSEEPQWFNMGPIDKRRAAEICLKAYIVRITLFVDPK
mgnify:CR=1 FL=1